MNGNLDSRKAVPLELLVYLVVLVIAAALRFSNLGGLPLTDHEASLALQALRLSKGEQVLISGEPGYIALTTLWFSLFESSVFTARFWPALAGTLLALTPLLYRERVGKAAALVLAGLVAVDPIMIGASRSAEGSMLALLGLLAAVGFAMRSKPLWCGFALGFALAGGPALWPGVICLAVFLLINCKSLRQVDNRFLALAAMTAMVTLVLLSTLFLINPPGISAFGSSLVDYWGSWRSENPAPLKGIAAAWGSSTLLVLVLSIWSLIQGFVRGEARAKWLGIWAGAALALILMNPARQLFDFSWATVPLLALAAMKLVELFPSFSSDNRIVFIAETVLVVALVVFSFMNAVNLVNNPLQSPEEYRNRAIGAVLPLFLLLGMTVLLAWGWSGASTREGFIAGVLLLAGFFTLANSIKAASLGSRPEIEIRRDLAAVVGSEELLRTIQDISRARTGIENRIDVLIVDLQSPSLEWALRSFEKAETAAVFDPTASPSLVITDVNQQITAGASYRGQKIIWQEEPDMKNMTIIDWLKWSFFRIAPLENREIILWARNDLFPGGNIP